MSVSREDWLLLWNIPEADAERAWTEKQSLDARHSSAMIISDHIDPVLSHADGRMYDSKSALYRTYRPEGNPQGVRYECIGEKIAEPYKRPARDKNLAREAVARTLSEMGF